MGSRMATMAHRLRSWRRPPRAARAGAASWGGLEPLEARVLLNGDPAPDLVAFAKALDAAGVQYFGTAWCFHCTDQKQLFEDGGHYLPFIEVTHPDRTINQAGIDNDITSFPTWIFQDGTRLLGSHPLATIEQLSGIDIPMSPEPYLAQIADTTLLAGSPLHVPLDGYDPNGDPLTYQVDVVVTEGDAVVTATVLENNRSLSIDNTSYGEMVFELFEQRVPRVTGHIIALAEDDFYDGVTFHRVMNGFVIQGGDPTGTGGGGSHLGDFDDQYHEDLQHNRTGLLSMAKSTDDTNDSQFFVTEVDEAVRPDSAATLRRLDFNHSVFGILVEGEFTRQGLSDVPTRDDDADPNNDESPKFTLTMDDVEVFEDDENAVVMLKVTAGQVGRAQVTVTVTDVDGNQFQRTFEVVIEADTFNGVPWIADVADVEVLRGTPIEIQLTAFDVEGDTPAFEAAHIGDVPYTFERDRDTGLVTVEPPADFIGQFEILVGVGQDAPDLDTVDAFDRQWVTITVNAAGADLVPQVDESRLPVDTVSGDGTRIRLPVTVANDGDTAIARGQRIELSVWARPVGSDGSQDVLVATVPDQSISNLRPGRAKRITINLQLPAGLATGDYVLVVTVDPANAVPEAVPDGDQNNTAVTSEAAAINVALGELLVDAAWGALSTPAAVVAGTSVSARAQIVFTNAGNIASGRAETLPLEILARPVAGGDDVLLADLGPQRMGGLRPGRQKRINARFQVHAATPEGTYRIVARFTAPDGAEQEIVTDALMTVAAPFVDLLAEIVNPRLPAATTSGDGTRITLPAQVTNGGNVPVERNARIEVQVFARPVGGGPDVLVATFVEQSVSNLKPGSSKRLNLRFQLPAGLATGNYVLVVEIDTADAVAETGGEANNTAVTDAGSPIAVTLGTIDLLGAIRPLNEEPGVQVEVGDTGRITADITNAGNVAVARQQRIDVQLFARPLAGGPDVLIGTLENQSISNLRPDRSKAVSRTVQIPPALQGGAYELVLIIDSDNDVVESNEANNEALLPGFNFVVV